MDDMILVAIGRDPDGLKKDVEWVAKEITKEGGSKMVDKWFAPETRIGEVVEFDWKVKYNIVDGSLDVRETEIRFEMGETKITVVAAPFFVGHYLEIYGFLNEEKHCELVYEDVNHIFEKGAEMFEKAAKKKLEKEKS